MYLDNLKMVKEYLLSQRTHYGLADFALFTPYRDCTFFGYIDEAIAISDNNSFYLLNANLFLTVLLPFISRKSEEIVEANKWYAETQSRFINKSNLVEIDWEDAVLNQFFSEQLQYFQSFLGDKVHLYWDAKNYLLMGESPMGKGYLYSKKLVNRS